ncbi:hypothetical protein N2W54_004287 [Lotmaria passim]
MQAGSRRQRQTTPTSDVVDTPEEVTRGEHVKSCREDAAAPPSDAVAGGELRPSSSVLADEAKGRVRRVRPRLHWTVRKRHPVEGGPRGHWRGRPQRTRMAQRMRCRPQTQTTRATTSTSKPRKRRRQPQKQTSSLRKEAR